MPATDTIADARAAFDAAFEAMLDAAARLRTAVLSEAGGHMTHPRIARIQHVVACHYEIPFASLSSHIRSQEYVLPRHIAIHLCTRFTSLSAMRIGAAFDRDHATILYARKAIRARIEQDPALQSTIALLEARVAEVLKAA